LAKSGDISIIYGGCKSMLVDNKKRHPFGGNCNNENIDWLRI
jgi:hypothetical protein